MLVKGLVITVEGEVRVVQIKGLPDMKAAIGGGWIEAIYPQSRPVSVIMDEEGKLKGLPFNKNATALFRGDLRQGDYLAGDVLILGKPNKLGRETDIPEDVLKEILG